MEEAGQEQGNNSLPQGVGEGARRKEKQRQQIREAEFILFYSVINLSMFK